MRVFLIGVDCATQANKTGLARSEFDGENCRLLDVKMGSKCLDPASKLCEWVKLSKDSPTLIALDAPLGWPDGFGNKLAGHEVGQPVKETCREKFFDRETDRVVKCLSKQKPLSVGADRIARTAFVALEILNEVRQKQKGQKLDVLVDRPMDIQGAQAIEVYPAATLKMYGYPNKGYKDKKNTDHRKIREEIINKLSEDFKPILKQCHRERMLDEPDALDAVVCILAALDFLKGKARGPESDLERARAEKEGWIWFKKPEERANEE